MKTFTNQAAQGDIFIRRIETLPETAMEVKPKNDKHIVAHSETGHHHFIQAANTKMYGDPNSMVCYLKIEEPTELLHDRPFDTHEALHFTPGTYEIHRQREFTPEGWRRVED